MSLVGLILVLAVLGFLVWLVLQISMPAPFPQIIIALVVIFTVVFLLQQFGVNTAPVPHLKLW